MFIDNLKKMLNEDFNISITENGAVGYRTAGKALLDINFAVSSMRNMEESEILNQFVKTFYEDKLLAVKWLFFARDVREGLGERRLFRICITYLAQKHGDIARAVLPLIPEYGRYDDMLCLLDTELQGEVADYIKTELDLDMAKMGEGRPISLLAKWLPSENASSKETRRLARILINRLGITERVYRKMLTKLRAYLDVVEVKMSSGAWDTIDYPAVPSRANLLYGKAFLLHDEQRRTAYLESLKKGETKINAGVLFPHDIVHSYYETDETGWRKSLKSRDDVTLEELWRALPDFVSGAGNTICVADGSGSMTAPVGKTEVTALEVANALAIYFAERSVGQFKDTYITFSRTPQLVDLSGGSSLREKTEIALQYNEVANTNIEAVFDLILTTAIRKKMEPEELPKNILILSDMEFDFCAVTADSEPWAADPAKKKLFVKIAHRYEKHGYQLPRLVFWNIISRTGTIPIKENDAGVALVSGFSPVIMKMVLSGRTDPLLCLLEQLNSGRYDAVEDALKNEKEILERC